MKLIQNFLTKNRCYISGKTITPKGVMVHSTGANNPYVKRYCQPNIQGIGVNQYNNDWNKDNLSVCVHAFIGKLDNGNIATVQTLPWNMRGWHCASGSKGSGNDTHISFEICEDDLKDATYFKKVYTEAVELTAYLCKLYNFDPMKDGVVICHSEGRDRGIASNHGDVMHWFPKHGKSMDDFRKDVKAEMSKSGVSTSTTSKTSVPYTVRLNSETEVYSAPAKTKIKGAYTIVEEKDGYGKLKSGVGWIKLSDATKI